MERPPSNRGIWVIAIGLSMVVVAGFVGWRVYLGKQTAGPEKVAVPPPTGPAATPAPVNLTEGDALLKAAASELSSEALFAKWLAEPDLVRRLVAATFQVSRGESPRELLTFLGPPGIFSVDEVEEPAAPAAKSPPKSKLKAKGKGKKPPKRIVHVFMNAASAARYDGVVRVISSVDTARLGRLYAKLAPFAEMVFREVGPPGKRLEDVFGAAVAHLTEVPLTDAPLEVVPLEKKVGYSFKDPKLEALSPAQKHLLRMGPANARTLVKKLQDFRATAFAPAGP